MEKYCLTTQSDMQFFSFLFPVSQSGKLLSHSFAKTGWCLVADLNPSFQSGKIYMRLPHPAPEYLYSYFLETVTSLQISFQLPPISNSAKILLKSGQTFFSLLGWKKCIAKVINRDQLPSISTKSLGLVNGSPSHWLSTNLTLEILILPQLDIKSKQNNNR